MRIVDANEGCWNEEACSVGPGFHGTRIGTVELDSREIYEAIARAAAEKFLRMGNAELVLPTLPRYSVSVFPDALARYVLLGRGVHAEIWDGYSEVVLRLLPEET